ncbi:MAG TPA: disulfide isomerase DsbC N-terminal domain-containing protein, partial [Methanoregulaceae archaeon]|nr:disulfide isomerase DsbC N-terminal domain-containing protein [Methanoregulaceae archaeon]
MKNKEISKWYVYITGILVIPVTIFVTVWFGHGKAGAANDQVRPDRLSQSQIEEKLKTVTPPNVKINSVEYLDYLGLYEVITPQFTFYMSQDGKYIIMGQVFETATRRNVTQEHVDSKRRVDLSALPPG